MVRDTSKVTVNDQQEVAYALSIKTSWTTLTCYNLEFSQNVADLVGNSS